MSHTVPLYERDRQLSALESLFAEARDGRGRVALVRGPVGSGKTELLCAFADRAVQGGAVLLSAAASYAERTVPYAVLAQLVRTAAITSESGAEALRLLHVAEGRPGGSESGRQASARILHRLCLAMLGFLESADGPVLVAVDDAHCADEPSLRCLASMVRRSRGTPVLLVCTESTDAEPPDLRLQAEFPPEPRGRRLGLEPLSLDGVARFLEQQLGPAAARRLAAECHAVSGGSPQIVRGLIEDNRAAVAGPRDRLVVASGFGQAVLRCLYRCEPATLALARQLALVGETIPAHQLAPLTGLDHKETARSLAALESMGVLSWGGFRHPRTALALLGSMAPAERADAYERTARLLYEAGIPAMTIARKVLAVGHATSACAVPVLHEAAEQALDDGQTGLALGVLRLAYQSDPDERRHARTAAMLARTEWRVDPYSARRWVRQVTSAVAAGHIPGRDALVAVGSSLWFGNPDRARELLRGIDNSASAADAETAAHVSASRLWLHVVYPSEDGTDARAARRALADIVTPTTLPQADAAVTMAELLERGPSAALVAEAELNLNRYQLEDRSVALLAGALTALILGDRLAVAGQWADSLAREAEALSAPAWCAQFTALKAGIALRRGAPREAAWNARTALAAIPPRSWGIAIGVPLGVLFQSLSLLGRVDETLRALRTPVPDAMFQTPVGAYYLQGRGHAHLATGRPDAALRDFLGAGELARGLGQDHPAFIPWRSDAAHLLLRLGSGNRARELAQEQLDLCGPDDWRARGLGLRSLAAVGDPAVRVKLLTRAMEELQRVDARLESAWVLQDLGTAYLALGDLSKGRMLRRSGRQIGEEVGAIPSLYDTAKEAKAQEDPAVRFERNGVAETLSDAEMRVATLAASGFSNRQIAGKLFVTVSTVEQHLTRVYRKLNVTRRSDIALKVLAETSEAV